jgi:hypothetical protein
MCSLAHHPTGRESHFRAAQKDLPFMYLSSLWQFLNQNKTSLLSFSLFSIFWLSIFPRSASLCPPQYKTAQIPRRWNSAQTYARKKRQTDDGWQETSSKNSLTALAKNGNTCPFRPFAEAKKKQRKGKRGKKKTAPLNPVGWLGWFVVRSTWWTFDIPLEWRHRPLPPTCPCPARLISLASFNTKKPK